MKIKNIIIENFRIFNGRYEFNFEDKDLIVVYGNNGNGKSTLFDSIEWAITGELLRYKGTNERTKFNYIFNSKIYEKQQGQVFVEITFENKDNDDLIIKRCWNKVNDNIKKEININGSRYNETDGGKLIRNLFVNDIRDEWVCDKNKFRDMFSASQLLSQDEISDFISTKNPTDRLLVMEKILGIDRYGEDFRKYLKNEIASTDKKNALLNKEKEGLEKEFNNLVYKIENEKSKVLFIEKQNRNLGNKNEDEILKELILLKNKELELGIFNKINDYQNINKEKQEKLIIHIEELSEKINENKKLQEDILLFLNRNKNAEKTKSLKEKLVNENNKFRDIVIKRDKSIEKYELKRQQLKDIIKVKGEIEKYQNKILDYVKVKDDLIIQINSIKKLEDIKQVEVKYKTLNNFTNEYENKELELEAIEKNIKFIEIKKEVNKLIELNEKYKKEITEKEIELNRIKNEIKTIDNSINKYSPRLDEEESAINQILYEIQNEIISDKFISNSCPVCGEDYKSVEILKEKVIKQLNESKRYFTDIQNLIRKLRADKFNNLREQNYCTVRINELNEKYKDNLNLIQEKNIILKSSNFNIGELVLEDVLKEAIKIKGRISEFIKNNTFTYRLIKNIYKLEEELQRITEEIKKVTQIIEEIKFENNIRNDLLEKSNEYIERRESKYKSFISECISNMQKYNDQIKDNIKKIDNYDKELVRLSLMKKNLEERTKTLFENEEEINTHLKKVEQRIDIVDKIKNNYKLIIRDINYILNNNEKNNILQDINKFNRDKKILELKIKDKKNHIEKSIEVVEGLKNILDESKSIQSDLMAKLIEDYSEYIDKLFFQISPHAYAKHIYLIPRKNDLFVILSDKEGRREELLALSDEELRGEANASLTLSSAQKNILGICIFIAFSNSQSWTKFNMLGIDDPFQNMDDINVYSFLDTLSGILSKKQVMISTHNEDFAYLICNKSSLDSERVKMVKLESYSEERVKYKQS